MSGTAAKKLHFDSTAASMSYVRDTLCSHKICTFLNCGVHLTDAHYYTCYVVCVRTTFVLIRSVERTNKRTSFFPSKSLDL